MGWLKKRGAIIDVRSGVIKGVEQEINKKYHYCLTLHLGIPVVEVLQVMQRQYRAIRAVLVLAFCRGG